LTKLHIHAYRQISNKIVPLNVSDNEVLVLFAALRASQYQNLLLKIMIDSENCESVTDQYT